MNTERFRVLAERVNAMSLRERVLVFGASLVVVFALVQTLFVDRIEARAKQAEARLLAAAEMDAQLAEARAQLGGQAGGDAEDAARKTLAAKQARLAELADTLARLERSLIPPERMKQVLKQIVSDARGVRVVGLKTQAPEAVALNEQATDAPPGFYRHGFEITVSGRYADLVAYLERLEALPWRLNWSEATLDAAGRPELTLTLVIHTLSLEAAWLRV